MPISHLAEDLAALSSRQSAKLTTDPFLLPNLLGQIKAEVNTSSSIL